MDEVRNAGRRECGTHMDPSPPPPPCRFDRSHLSASVERYVRLVDKTIGLHGSNNRGVGTSSHNKCACKNRSTNLESDWSFRHDNPRMDHHGLITQRSDVCYVRVTKTTPILLTREALYGYEIAFLLFEVTNGTLTSPPFPSALAASSLALQTSIALKQYLRQVLMSPDDAATCRRPTRNNVNRGDQSTSMGQSKAGFDTSCDRHEHSMPTCVVRLKKEWGWGWGSWSMTFFLGGGGYKQGRGRGRSPHGEREEKEEKDI